MDVGQLKATLYLDNTPFLASMQEAKAAKDAAGDLNINAGASGGEAAATSFRSLRASIDEASASIDVSTQKFSDLNVLMKDVVQNNDSLGRAVQVTTQQLNDETSAVRVQITGYDDLNNKTVITASVKGEVTEASRLAGTAAEEEAAKQGLLAKSATAASIAERELAESQQYNNTHRGTIDVSVLEGIRAENQAKAEAIAMNKAWAASDAAYNNAHRGTIDLSVLEGIRAENQEKAEAIAMNKAWAASDADAAARRKELNDIFDSYNNQNRGSIPLSVLESIRQEKQDLSEAAEMEKAWGVETDKATGSLVRMTSSMNDNGQAHIRLAGAGGPLTLTAIALAIVSAAALKEAADLETASIRIQNFSGASNQQNLGGLTNFGQHTDSAGALAQAYAPVSGELAGLSGATNDSAQATKILTDAQKLANATGEEVTTTTKAEVETLRNFKLTANDAGVASDVLYNSEKLLGQGSGQIAQSLGLIREQLGILNPSLQDAAEILDVTGQHGADGARQVSAFTAAIDKATDGSKASHDTLQKLGIQIVDTTTGAYLPMTAIIKEMAQSELGAGTAASTASAAMLVGAKEAQPLVDFLIEERKRSEEGSFELQHNGQVATDSSKQIDSLGGAWKRLKTELENALAVLGEKIEPVFLKIANAADRLQTHLMNVNIFGGLEIKIGEFLLAIGKLDSAMAKIPGIGYFGGEAKAVTDAGNALINYGHIGDDYHPDGGTPGGSTAPSGNIPSAATGVPTSTVAAGLSDLYPHISNVAAANGVDPRMLAALFQNETAFDPNLAKGWNINNFGSIMGTKQNLPTDVPINNPQPGDPGLVTWLQSYPTPEAGIQAAINTFQESQYGGTDSGSAWSMLKSGNFSGFAEKLQSGGYAGRSPESANFASQLESILPTIPQAPPASGNYANNSGIGTGGLPGLGNPLMAGNQQSSQQTSVAPVTGYTITQPFGSTENPGGVEPGGVHQGVDLGVDAGTLVRATQAGTITGVTGADNKGIVTEALANGMTAIYEHVDPALVKVGEQVKAGQEIAKVGDHPFDANTWPSTGPHLHFQIDDANGKPIDPTAYLTGRGAAGAFDPYGPSTSTSNAADPAARAAEQSGNDTESFLNTQRRLSDATPPGTAVIDPAMIDAQNLKVSTLKASADEQEKIVEKLQADEAAANAAGNIKQVNTIHDSFVTAQKIYTDDVAAYERALSEKNRLVGQQKAQGAATEQVGVAQDTLDQSIDKLTEKQSQASLGVTKDMVDQDNERVQNAQAAANAQVLIVQAAIDAENDAAKSGDTVAADLAHQQVVKAQKDLSEDVTTFTTANATKIADVQSLVAEQRAAAEASRTLNQDQIAQSKDTLDATKNIGLQIPDSWKQGLSEAHDAVQSAYAQIIVLDQVLQGQMSADDRTALNEKRVELANQITDTKSAYSDMAQASQLYNTGITDQQRAQFALAKADRAADLKDIIARNQDALNTQIDTIQRGEQSQIASLATSEEVDRIRADSLIAQSQRATDANTRQKDLLDAQLANQTADIEANEQKQINDLRSSEQEKLKAYNDILLQYQEAQATANAVLQRNQADFDLAKADMDIATAELQIQLAHDVQDNVDAATDSQVQALQAYISKLPDYIAGVQKANDVQTTYSESLIGGATQAKAAIDGLTQSIDNQVNTVTQKAGNQISVLGAKNQATQANQPTDTASAALQSQLDSLTVIKDRVNLTLLGQQQQVTALQAQNTILTDQVTLANDQFLASSAMLQLQGELLGDAVQKDQLQLDLLNATSDAQQSLLAGLKEQLVVQQSQDAVLNAQATLATDQNAIAGSTVANETAQKTLAVQIAQTQLQIVLATNTAAQATLASLNSQGETLKANLSIMQAQLKLNQDQSNASPANLALTAELNALHVQQDELATAGLKNAALDNEVTRLEAQQKLLQSQTTLADTGLAAQVATQTVQGDQLDLAIAQVTAMETKNNSLQYQLTTEQAQLAVLTAQQSVTTAQNALNGLALTQQQNIEKVKSDQYSLSIAQNSVITSQQAQLTIQLDSLTRETTQLTSQKQLLTDQNGLTTLALTQQAAINKVQADQLNIQNAEVAAQNAMVGGLDATIARLQSQLSLSQAIYKVQQTTVAQTPTGPTPTTPTTPNGPTPTASAPIPIGTTLSGGPYNGYKVVNQVNVNIGGKTVTELVLENMANGQITDMQVA